VEFVLVFWWGTDSTFWLPDCANSIYYKAHLSVTDVRPPLSHTQYARCALLSFHFHFRPASDYDLLGHNGYWLSCHLLWKAFLGVSLPCPLLAELGTCSARAVVELLSLQRPSVTRKRWDLLVTCLGLDSSWL
jgi:hypothetical protein